MGDGEDAHLFANHFVNDAVGTDDELAKAVDIRRDVEEALVRDGATHQGRVGQQIDAILDLPCNADMKAYFKAED